MSLIGYARVSSWGQSLDVQLEKLSHCDLVFKEKQSARTDAREQLQKCLNYLCDGDTLTITKLDRLARSTRDLLNIMQRLVSSGIKFGRKRSLSSEQIQEVLLKRSEGIKVVELMAEYGLSKASIYRALGGINQVQD